ncbi:hypothetical protein ASF56_18790 [Methylobacterium sp. Leaf122]|nr:hypothetical protein ASF56_18790 [Methylobacterium sp. Leaf122]
MADGIESVVQIRQAGAAQSCSLCALAIVDRSLLDLWHPYRLIGIDPASHVGGSPDLVRATAQRSSVWRRADSSMAALN